MCAGAQYITGLINIIVIKMTMCQVLRQLSIKQIVMKQLLWASATLGPVAMRKGSSYPPEAPV